MILSLGHLPILGTNPSQGPRVIASAIGKKPAQFFCNFIELERQKRSLGMPEQLRMDGSQDLEGNGSSGN